MLIYLCYIVTPTYVGFHLFIFQVVATFAAFASEKSSNSPAPLKYLICTEFLPTNQPIDMDVRNIYYH